MVTRGALVCMLVYNSCTTDARVLKEAGTLTAAGYRVRVIALLERGLEPFERRDGFEIVRIERRPLHYRAVSRLRRVARRPAGLAAPAAAGSSRPPVPRSEPPPARRMLWGVVRRFMGAVHRPLMMLDYHLRALRVIRAEPPALVHAHDLLTLPTGIAAKRLTSARVIYDAHELYPEVSTLSERERRTWAWIERRLIGRADRVVTVCESIGEELVRRYGIERPTIILNCPPRAHPGPALGPEALGADGKTGPVVLYTGGFVPNRGLETLVLSAHGLSSGTIVLLGSGRLRPELERLVRSEDLEERVAIRPPVPPEELPAHTAAADVGVIPYEPVGLNNRFTAPNKLFEYMSAGLPIVASRLPELQRFVGDPGRGLLFEPGDPASLAEALNRILGDDGLRRALAAASSAGGAEFTWEGQAPIMLDLYRSTTPTGPRTSGRRRQRPG